MSSETVAWLPSSSEERALEAQLACVHPDVCLVAASENVAVPDPEDACSVLPHRTARSVVKVQRDSHRRTNRLPEVVYVHICVA